MSNDLTKTVRIVRKPKVALDERGHTVWVDEVETAEFELVSTMMLEAIIDSDDDAQKQNLKELASEKDGMLARNAEQNRFEIVDDEDLMAALSAADDPNYDAEPRVEVVSETTADEEFELVSTQMLRKMLDPDGETTPDGPDEGGGFDPYNSS